MWNEEVQQLDENTAPEPRIHYEADNGDISPEELHQLDENDPGYVNGLVLDYENEKDNPRNTYRETGNHTGAIRWDKYAVEGSEKYVTLKPGTVVGRWGNEEGTFAASPDTSYDKLELPVVEEKQTKRLYEVCKPFPVEISNVKKQPWNKNISGDETTKQIKLPASVKQLVEEQYLRLLDKEREK